MANQAITAAVESAIVAALKIAKPELGPEIDILAGLLTAYEAAKSVGALTSAQVDEHTALAASQIVAKNFTPTQPPVTIPGAPVA